MKIATEMYEMSKKIKRLLNAFSIVGDDDNVEFTIHAMFITVFAL